MLCLVRQSRNWCGQISAMRWLWSRQILRRWMSGTKKRVRNEGLSCVMSCCSSNRKAPILGFAQSAIYPNLPLSLDRSKSSMYYCCSNVVCNGCIYAYQIREMETRRENSRLQYTCPFCREPFPPNHDEGDKLMMKRLEANDLVALCQEGSKLFL